jgi:hypothetical protein
MTTPLSEVVKPLLSIPGRGTRHENVVYYLAHHYGILTAERLCQENIAKLQIPNYGRMCKHDLIEALKNLGFSPEIPPPQILSDTRIWYNGHIYVKKEPTA